MIWVDACVHFPGEKSYHANKISFWRNHVELQKFAVFLKSIRTIEVQHRNLHERFKSN